MMPNTLKPARELLVQRDTLEKPRWHTPGLEERAERRWERPGCAGKRSALLAG